jgi:deoxyribodipyrimidine photolyase
MSNSKDPVIYWLREDFRIHDNLALTEAAKDNKNLILVYFSNYLDKQPGSAQEVWINNSFLEITKKYDEIYGLNIQCYDGDPIQYLEELHKKFGVSEIYINEVFDPRTKKKR